jgi:hypothetical protein
VTTNERIEIGGAVIDPHKHELTRKGKTPGAVVLRGRAAAPAVGARGQPVSREEILEKIWGVPGHAGTRSVDNFVVKLRKKIEENAAKPEHILTIYGRATSCCLSVLTRGSPPRRPPGRRRRACATRRRSRMAGASCAPTPQARRARRTTIARGRRSACRTRGTRKMARMVGGRGRTITGASVGTGGG